MQHALVYGMEVWRSVSGCKTFRDGFRETIKGDAGYWECFLANAIPMPGHCLAGC